MPRYQLLQLANETIDVLTAHLYELRREERHRLVELLAYLAELDRRDVCLELGFPSLFKYLTDHLGYPPASAFRRMTAARLLARFPAVAEYLADGRLCLTTLVELRDVLELDRLDEILGRAAGRTQEQVKELVAALRPRPAPADLLRPLPGPTNRQADLVEATTVGPEVVVISGPEASVTDFAAEPAQAPPAASSPSKARIEPISEGLHVLRVTVGREFVDDLDAVRSALSHEIPNGDLARLLGRCLKITREVCERRRRGTGRPAPTSPRPPRKAGSRFVAAAERDAVWRRDEGRCAFVGQGGRRCGSTHQLQVHHLVPHALGGPPTVANLALFCAIHNRHQARRELGEEHVERAISERQKRQATLP